MAHPSPQQDRHISQIVIPARLASTRLPRKLLLDETGMPLICHTYQAATRATRANRICVAADHEKIVQAVQTHGGQAVMTDPNARCGTDRVAEVARSMPEVDFFVNVQGDEPEIAGEAIDQVIGLLEKDPQAVMATLATPIRTCEQLEDPACVKVVFDSRGRAMYFSRSVIPHPRDWHDDLLDAQPAHFYQHIGLYAYRRDFLLELSQMPAARTESLESLEQLRVLEAGYSIMVGVTDHATIGIDTPGDYRAFVERYRATHRQAG